MCNKRYCMLALAKLGCCFKRSSAFMDSQYSKSTSLEDTTQWYCCRNNKFNLQLLTQIEPSATIHCFNAVGS